MVHWPKTVIGRKRWSLSQKSELNVLIRSKPCIALWDTGSMVCLVNASWLEQELPNKKILRLSEVSERITNGISLKTANNSEIVLNGVVVLEFALPNYAKYVFSLHLKNCPTQFLDIIWYSIWSRKETCLQVYCHLSVQSLSNLICYWFHLSHAQSLW